MKADRSAKALTADRDQAVTKHPNQAMQRYLSYLRSDNQTLSDEDQLSYINSVNAWHEKPVSYPPYED